MALLYDCSSGKNMDGGWGWVVMGSSFMLNLITNGSTYTFGLIFVELLADFKAGEAVTSYIVVLMQLKTNRRYLTICLGLFVGTLGKAVGWRPMPIAGGIISGIGFGALAPNIYVLYLTCGVLTGIGNGFMYATSVMCFHGYFNKYRAMASGIIVSGCGLGLIVFSLLSNYLLTHYNWRVTFAVYGAISLVVGIICGLLLKPPVQKSQERNSLLIIEDQLEAEYVQHDHDTHSFQLDSNKSSPNKEKPFYGSIDENDINSLEIHADKESHLGSANTNAMPSLRQCSRQKEPQPIATESNYCLNMKRVAQAMKNVLDFSLLKNPILCFIAAAKVSFPFGYHVVYTYSPERALWFGLSQTKATSLMSVMGVSNIVFRLVAGCIGDQFPGFRFYLLALSYMSMGVLGIMISIFDSYPAMIVFIVLYGLASGTVTSLSSVVMVDILGVDNIEKSMGIGMIFTAVGFMIASPMAGLIIKRSGDINLPFEVVGFIGILGGAAYFCILCLIPKYGVK